MPINCTANLDFTGVIIDESRSGGSVGDVLNVEYSAKTDTVKLEMLGGSGGLIEMSERHAFELAKLLKLITESVAPIRREMQEWENG